MPAAQSPQRPRRRSSILLVAYFYPPCRDAGARRAAAMAKWLRRMGHSVTVLTTRAYGAHPRDHQGPTVRTVDAQLWRARLRGRMRAESLFDSDTYSGRPHALSRVLVPEPLIAAWAPFARSRALRLNRRDRFDCVVTTAPPESTHLVGCALRRRDVPWVADVRDPWMLESLRPPFPTAAQRHLDARMERRWLSRADVVVCVSRPAAVDLRARGIAAPILVPNGWDPDDEFEAAAALSSARDLLSSDRISLVYTGRLSGDAANPEALVAALRRVAEADPDVAARLELVIAGPLTPDERRLLSVDTSPARIVIAGTLSRDRALALQRAADALLLLTSPALSQRLNIKLFEYLAARRPIVAIAGGTEAGRLVRELGGAVVRADDEKEIAAVLERVARGAVPAPPPDAVSSYSYPRPAEQMVEAVERAIEVAAGRGSRRGRRLGRS